MAETRTQLIAGIRPCGPTAYGADPETEMELIGTIPVRGSRSPRIELMQGDLTAIGPDEGFDVLVVSAFPDDYFPTRTSLIGALFNKGLSVKELAAGKDLDLRTAFSCWLSKDLGAAREIFHFDRILCFEPLVRGEPPAVVGDIFRALTPILAEHADFRSVAMPLVAAGNQGYAAADMLDPLLDAAIHWLERGLPLDVLKIVTLTEQQTNEARALFLQRAAQYAASDSAATVPGKTFDVFISYAHENADDIEIFEQALLRANPLLRIFLDRKTLDVGCAWQPEIFESLDRCRKVVAMFSPDYLASKVCKEEFNIAWVRGREHDEDIIFPIFLHSADLPTYMTYRNYLDCREGDRMKIESAAGRLVESLKRTAHRP
ncbi:hypothetical protein CCZ27_17665 [Thauera sinica]|nr:hypothetical protein CCZ27_17665 [Thauera sp. K11]